MQRVYAGELQPVLESQCSKIRVHHPHSSRIDPCPPERLLETVGACPELPKNRLLIEWPFRRSRFSGSARSARHPLEPEDRCEPDHAPHKSLEGCTDQLHRCTIEELASERFIRQDHMLYFLRRRPLAVGAR